MLSFHVVISSLSFDGSQGLLKRPRDAHEFENIECDEQTKRVGC